MEDMRLLAPACLERDQELLFELQLACFHKLAAEGFTAEAIRFSRSHLTPLTQDQPHLIPRVKVTLPASNEYMQLHLGGACLTQYLQVCCSKCVVHGWCVSATSMEHCLFTPSALVAFTWWCTSRSSGAVVRMQGQQRPAHAQLPAGQKGPDQVGPCRILHGSNVNRWTCVQAAVARAVTDPGEARACLRPAFLSQLAATRMQRALDIKEPLLVQLLRVRPPLLCMIASWCSLL